MQAEDSPSQVRPSQQSVSMHGSPMPEHAASKHDSPMSPQSRGASGHRPVTSSHSPKQHWPASHASPKSAQHTPSTEMPVQHGPGWPIGAHGSPLDASPLPASPDPLS